MEYKENIESCDDYFVPENIEKDVDEGDNDRLFLFCIMKTNYCLDLESSDTLQGERDPNVLTCMESFGWVQCNDNYQCKEESGEQCLNHRCS